VIRAKILSANLALKDLFGACGNSCSADVTKRIFLFYDLIVNVIIYDRRMIRGIIRARNVTCDNVALSACGSGFCCPGKIGSARSTELCAGSNYLTASKTSELKLVTALGAKCTAFTRATAICTLYNFDLPRCF